MTFSFLEYLFFVSEIFKFLYYASEETDDVIGGSTKTAQHSVFFKLGTSNVHDKRNIITHNHRNSKVNYQKRLKQLEHSLYF